MACGFFPQPQLLAAPIHHALRIDTRVGGHPADELLVSFTAKLAVRSATSAYALQLQLPSSGTCHGDIAGTMTNTDIAAGKTTQLNLAYAHAAGLLHCPGVYRGTVYYLHSTTSAGGIAAPLQAPTPHGTEPPGTITTVVGQFSFRVK